MKKIIKLILLILCIILVIVYNFSYKTTILNDGDIDNLEIEYNLNFSDNEWRITKYKKNTIIGKKNEMFEARNFQINTISPSSIHYAIFTFAENEIFDTALPWANNTDKVLLEKTLENELLIGKVEVIYALRNKVTEKEYYPIYRFTFTYSDLNFVIEFHHGSGEHKIYNIDEKEIHQEELDAYIEYINNILKL